MKVRYIKESEYFSYESNGGYCGFGISLEKLRTFLKDNYIDYDDKALTTVGTTMSNEDFAKLQSFWFEDRYQEHRGLYFCREHLSSKKDIANTIVTAINSSTPLCVIFESGYCEYPSDEETDPMVSQDGLTHIILVGKTTGEKKFPLALASKYSDGGGVLSLYGIKEVILLKGL